VRRTILIAIAAAVMLGLAPPTAQAWPSGCSYWQIDSQTTGSLCSSGTGYHRAALNCRKASGKIVYRPGFSPTGKTWSHIDQLSIAYCQAGERIAFYGIELKN
jgi:hypothetical protein